MPICRWYALPSDYPRFSNLDRLIQIGGSTLLNRFAFTSSPNRSAPHFMNYHSVILELMKSLVSNNISKYLDLGCNDGVMTKYFANKIGAKKVFGADIHSGILERAQVNGIETFLWDLNNGKAPFPDESFDTITAFEVIEHLVNPDNMFREVNRLLKKNCHFFLSTPNLASWSNRLALLFGKQPRYAEVSSETCVGYLGKSKINSMPAGHLRIFTLPALKALLKYHNFEILKVRGAEATYASNYIKLIDKVFNVLPSLSRIIIIGAIKR